jgi:hypothetical protein
MDFDLGENENKDKLIHMLSKQRRWIGVCVLFASAVCLRADPIRATITFTQGHTFYSYEGSAMIALEQPMTLPSRSKISTGLDGKVFSWLVPGVRFELQPSSELQLTQQELFVYFNRPVVHILLDLQQGTIQADISNLQDPSFFKIRTPQGIFSTQHGHLIVSYNGQGGFAQVTGGALLAILNNGQQIIVTSGKVLEITGVEPRYQITDIKQLTFEQIVQLNGLPDKMDKLEETLRQVYFTSFTTSEGMVQNNVINDYILNQVILNQVVSPPNNPANPTNPIVSPAGGS